MVCMQWIRKWEGSPGWMRFQDFQEEVPVGSEKETREKGSSDVCIWLFSLGSTAQRRIVLLAFFLGA